jgi:hypothetical protein
MKTSEYDETVRALSRDHLSEHQNSPLAMQLAINTLVRTLSAFVVSQAEADLKKADDMSMRIETTLRHMIEQDIHAITEKRKRLKK